MAIGEVKGICKKCRQEFTVRKKFHKGNEAREFEQKYQDYYDECPECYSERRRAEKEAEEKPIIIGLKISKRDIRAWKKYLLLENVEQEIVILKEIKKIKMSGRPPKKSEYNNWLAAHRGCEQK